MHHQSRFRCVKVCDHCIWNSKLIGRKNKFILLTRSVQDPGDVPFWYQYLLENLSLFHGDFTGKIVLPQEIWGSKYCLKMVWIAKFADFFHDFFVEPSNTYMYISKNAIFIAFIGWWGLWGPPHDLEVVFSLRA